MGTITVSIGDIANSTSAIPRKVSKSRARDQPIKRLLVLRLLPPTRTRPIRPWFHTWSV